MRKWQSKWLACVLALMMVLSMSVAVSAEDDAVTYDLAACADQVKLIGRTVVTDDGIVPHTTASGIAFYSDCSGDIEMTIRGGDGHCALFDHQYFIVYVDGEEYNRVELKYRDGKQAKETLTVAEDLDAGMHRIEILRETEEVNARCVFEDITLNGDLQPVADAPMLIEFVGDSITTGYGAYPVTKESMMLAVDDPIRQAGTKSYAYLTAADLGMDVQVCCTSGYGVEVGWNIDNANLQKMYEYTAYHNNHDASDDTAFWPFERTADVVVINLGTNDKSCHKASDAAVGIAIKNFMQQVRDKNPDAKVVWVTGMMGTHYKPQVEDAVASLGGAEEGYYFCLLPLGTSGGAGHPNGEEHAAAADVLTEFLKSDVLGDEYIDGYTTVEEMESTLSLAKLIPGSDAAIGEAELAAYEASGNEVSGTMTTVHDNLRSQVTLGFVIAGAVLVLLVLGLILFAVLYNPKKPAAPSETAKASAETLEDKIETAMDSLEEKLEVIEEKIETALEKAENTAEAAVDAAEEKLENTEEKIEE